MTNLLIANILLLLKNQIRVWKEKKKQQLLVILFVQKISYNSRSKYHTERTCASCYRFMNRNEFI